MALQFQKRKEPFTRRGHFLALLCFCALLSLVATSAAPRHRQRAHRARPTPTPTPAATPIAPTIEFQALPGEDNVGRGETITFSLFVSNKSNVTLNKFKLNVSDPAFETVKQPIFPPTLPPFGNVRAETVLKVGDKASFAPHKMLLTLEYAWDLGGGQEAVSAQSVPAAVQVTRRFEEEAKGFPGGTAAFLYLLLPIIPAMLSYQFVESLRKGQVTMPTFKTEYVVPAFFAAVVLSFIMLLAFNRDNGLNYSDPRVFIAVLLTSLVVGALVPGFRLALGAWRMWRWGFDNTDTPKSYLRKALLAPGTPREFRRVTGNANGEEWEGMLLKQPNGATVLGAQLGVSPMGEPGEVNYQDRLTKLTTVVFDAGGALIDRRQLIKMVESNDLNLELRARVMRGDAPINEPVVIDEVSGFQQGNAAPQPRPLIVPTN
jgi:hypothetical protein